MSRDSVEIRRYLSQVPPGSVIAEIGVHRGVFSEILWTCCRPQILVLIDSWEPYGDPREPMSRMSPQDHLDSYRQVLARFSNRPAVQVWRMRSVDAHAVAGMSFDFVYLDADHRYEQVLIDLRNWSGRLTPCGMIGGHDYTKQRPDIGVVDAVTDFCRESGFRLSDVTREQWPSFILKRDADK